MSATLPESRELVDAAMDADTLDAAFERFYFDDDGVHLEELWRDVMKSPIVEPWKPMIEQTRAAFDAELYLPSVAALLPVMDGLAHSAWGRRFYKAKYRERFFADKLSSVEPNTVSYYLWRSVSTFVAAIFADASVTPPRRSSTVTGFCTVEDCRAVVGSTAYACSRPSTRSRT